MIVKTGIRVISTAMLLAVMICTSCINDDYDSYPPQYEEVLDQGDPLPTFDIIMNDGRKITNEDFTDKVSLIVFFNTSCSDCRKELPVIQRFYDENPKYPVVCSSREENEMSVSKYWESEGLTLPFSPQADRTVYNMFALTLIPRIYVIDKAANVAAIFTDNPLVDYATLYETVRRTDGY